MNKKIIMIAAAVLVIGGGVYYASQRETFSSLENQTAPASVSGMPVPTDGVPVDERIVTPPSPAFAPQDEPTDASVKKEFTVSGKNFGYSLSTIMVSKGDMVKITFKDEDGFHDLVVDGYNVKTERLNTGGEAVIEFTADKTGSFEYYCSVGQHRENGMHGTLVVE
ncbi:MAG: cupredoxin domain-containing protein [Candidatus Sungbacteria bacterium]|nr:cupredoxin domain-containing protein [Candidatus Sungbacteria bacterium]